jgi:ABC-2 type transport system ATP-binding protein
MSHPIELRDIHKGFGAVQALRGFSLTVPEGVIYGVLGPNGSGKTTAIRTIAGLLKADRGSATVLGRPAGSPEVRVQIGYMPQAAALYEELSVRANLRFFASLVLDDPDDAVERALSLVELVDRAASPVHTLSGGLRQRASLACSIVHQPRLLLLDEPTVGVDPDLRASFWEYFRELANGGATILISSHVMDEAERCDRLGLVRDGRLLREGTARSLPAEVGAASLEEAFLHLSRGADVSS